MRLPSRLAAFSVEISICGRSKLGAHFWRACSLVFCWLLCNTYELQDGSLGGLWPQAYLCCAASRPQAILQFVLLAPVLCGVLCRPCATNRLASTECQVLCFLCKHGSQALIRRLIICQSRQAGICPFALFAVHCGCLQAQEMQETDHRHISDLETLNKMLRRELEAVRKQVGPSPETGGFGACCLRGDSGMHKVAVRKHV